MRTSATPINVFDHLVTVLPDVVADTCLARREHGLTDEQQRWFIEHVSRRTRWLHANVPSWRTSLESPGDSGRDQLHAWVEHWLSAYLQDPANYQERHPHVLLD